jgi:transposase
MFYMYIRLTRSKKSKHATIQIVQGIRDGAKVKQKIVASLGVIKSQDDLQKLSKLAEHLIDRLRKEGLPLDLRVQVNKLIHRTTVYNGFKMATTRLMHLTGFVDVLKTSSRKQQFDLEEVLMLILSQQLNLPGSKMRAYERQEEHGFFGINLQNLYRAMDIVEPLSEAFQKQALETAHMFSKRPLDCFFFDVTTLYFESTEQDELKNFGFSKDQKHHCVQIVLALVVDGEGLPLAYETFSGNLAETKTLIPVLTALRKRLCIKNVIVVCDRGMASEANVQAVKKKGFHYVIATKLRSMARSHQINDLSLYTPLPNQDLIPEQDKTLFRVMPHPQYTETTLIATYSPSRARKDQQDRDRLLEKLQMKLSSTSEEASIKRIISNHGYKKFTAVKRGSKISLDQEAIEEDRSWDGFHGIAVSNSSGLDVLEALARYRELWHVEETFRVAKHTLKARPMFHWAPRRIRAHILFCFLSLFLERFLEKQLRENGTPLTPDKIQHALAGVHTLHFEDTSIEKLGKMESTLSVEARSIFHVLGLPMDRTTTAALHCCV